MLGISLKLVCCGRIVIAPILSAILNRAWRTEREKQSHDRIGRICNRCSWRAGRRQSHCACLRGIKRNNGEEFQRCHWQVRFQQGHRGACRRGCDLRATVVPIAVRIAEWPALVRGRIPDPNPSPQSARVFNQARIPRAHLAHPPARRGGHESHDKDPIRCHFPPGVRGRGWSSCIKNGRFKRPVRRPARLPRPATPMRPEWSRNARRLLPSAARPSRRRKPLARHCENCFVMGSETTAHIPHRLVPE